MAKTLKIKIDGDASGFKAATDEADGLVGKLGRTLGGIGKTVATAGAAIGALGVGLGAKLGIDSVKAASDLGETMSKVGVLFGDSAKQVESFADAAAKNLGQSKQQALDAAATFATFGKGAGLSGDQLAKFSTDFTGLASDLASFNNTTPQEAIEAIGAALRGENEPIRKYGVMIDEAALKAEAFSLGLIKAEVDSKKLSRAQEAQEKAQRKVAEAAKKYGASSQQAADATRDYDQATASLAEVLEGKLPANLTSQQKTLAAQSLIFKQTTDAQGDFARTSDGLANKQRILAAQFANVKVKIGEQLLPIALKLADALSKTVIPAFEKFGPIVAQKVGAAVQAFAGWVQRDAVPAVQSFAGWVQNSLIPAIQNMAGWINEHIVPAVQSFAGWVQNSLIPAVQSFAGWVQNSLIPAIQNMAGWINDNVVPAVRAFAGWVQNSLIPAFQAAAQWIGEKVIPILQDLAKWFNDDVRPALEGIWGAINDNLVPALQNLWGWIADNIIPVIRAVAEDQLPRLWEGFKTFAGILLDYVIPGIVDTIKIIVNIGLSLIECGIKIAGFVIDAVAAFARFATGVGKKVGEAIEFFTGLPGKILDKVGDLGSTLYDAGAELIGGLLRGIKDSLSKVWDEVSSIAGKIRELKGPLPYDAKVLIPNGQALMAGLATGIRQGLGEVNSLVSGIAPQMAVTGVGDTGGGGGAPLNVTINGAVGSRDEIIRWVREGIRQAERAQR